MTDRRSKLDRRLAHVCAQFPGELGIAARNLQTGETVSIEATRPFPTASTFKVPVMIEIFRQAEVGSLALDDRISMAASDRTRGSGVLKEMQPGLACTTLDLITLMIIVSDNTATNMLIDLAGGVSPINDTLKNLGFERTTVHMKIDFDAMDWQNRRMAEASPEDLMGMMASIARDELISPAASQQMRDILGRQHYLDQAPRYLAFNPYGAEFGIEQSLWVGNKTGALPGMRADCGIIRLLDQVDIAFAVMNDVGPDSGPNWENDSEIVNGVVGRLLVDYWWAEVSSEPAPVLSSPYLDTYAID